MNWKEAKSIGISSIEMLEPIDNLGDAPDFNVWSLEIVLDDRTVWNCSGEGFDYWGFRDWMENLDNIDEWEKMDPDIIG